MSGYQLGCDAERDLDALWEYVAQKSVEAADRLIAGLFDAFDTLARNPRLGHTREDLTSLPLLFWPVGNYLVIYRTQTTVIQIVAIVHGKRDIPTFLRRRGSE